MKKGIFAAVLALGLLQAHGGASASGPAPAVNVATRDAADEQDLQFPVLDLLDDALETDEDSDAGGPSSPGW